MKPACLSLFSLLTLGFLAGNLHASDDFLDAFSDRLILSDPRIPASLRVSGLLDLEGYSFGGTAPGLIQTDHSYLINPRLTLFLDAQMGKKFYFFAQARVDRGFDPTDDGAQVRLDEYALRFTPFADANFNVQIGKFATIVGNWANRHSSWDNPFITAPLPYENLTSIWDSSAPDSATTLVEWYESDKYLRSPVIWGPSYTSGLAISGRFGTIEYAAEIKNSSLSSRPEAWDLTQIGFQHPTYSARLGWRPDEAWNLGLSGSLGSYLLPEAASTLAPGHGIEDYRQILIAQDFSYAWHNWQVWAEFFESRFEIPTIGNADTLAYYIEAKYKFTPQLFGALRWNQQLYNTFRDDTGSDVTWTNDIWRIDAALTWRLTPHIQTKLQYSFSRPNLEDQEFQNMIAGQLTFRF